MSEESSSTPLRLKPKLRIEAEGASATSASAPESNPGDVGAQTDGEANQRMRLKPRLAAADSGASPAAGPVVPVEAAVPPATAAETKVRLKPRLSAGSDVSAAPAPVAADDVPPPVLPAADVPGAIVDQQAPAAMIGGFKLKPKAASEEPPPLPAAEAIGKGTADAAVPTGTVEAPPPPKFRVKPSPDVVKSFDETAKVTPPPAEARRRSPVLVLALLVVLLGGGGYYGYFGYRTFLAPGGEVAPEPAESAATETPASLAGQMVAKARDAAAAQSGRFEGMEEAGAEALPPAAAKTPPVPGAADSVMAAMPPRVEAPAPAPEPSAAFTRFVSEMRISGVFQGDPPRALINGRTIRAGEPIDIGLGIVFTGIDVDRRLIVMREASGAIAAKKY